MTAQLPFIPHILEDDVEHLLRPADSENPGRRGWLPYHLGRAEQASGMDAHLDLPDSWNTVSALDDWPVQRLPAVVIVAGRTDRAPVRETDGTYRAWYVLTLAFVVSAGERYYARRLAGAYAMAGAEAVAWHLRRESARVTAVEWTGFTADPLPLRSRDRVDTVAAGQCAFLCLIKDVVSDAALIRDPPEDPYAVLPDGPLVETADVTTTLT